MAFIKPGFPGLTRVGQTLRTVKMSVIIKFCVLSIGVKLSVSVNAILELMTRTVMGR